MLSSFSRSAIRARSVARIAIKPQPITLAVRYNSGGAHAYETESFEAFNQRYESFFTSCGDLFELQRGLNNCFAYDLVPTVSVITAALKAARKVNDYATAVRILEGVREKVENKGQYQNYLAELKPLTEELGITSKEELYGITL